MRGADGRWCERVGIPTPAMTTRCQTLRSGAMGPEAGRRAWEGGSQG